MAIDFEKFYSNHSPYLYRFTISKLKAYNLTYLNAGDIVQECVYKLFRVMGGERKIDTFKGTELNLRVYMCSMIINNLIDVTRSARHRNEYALFAEEENFDDMQAEKNPGVITEASKIVAPIRETGDAYLELLQDSLTYQQIRVFILRYLGMSYIEIQDLLNIGKRAVSYRLTRIKQVLEDIMEI